MCKWENAILTPSSNKCFVPPWSKSKAIICKTLRRPDFTHGSTTDWPSLYLRHSCPSVTPRLTAQNIVNDVSHDDQMHDSHIGVYMLAVCDIVCMRKPDFLQLTMAK